MLNWKLLSHPFNWLTVWLMIFIAGIFGHLLLTLFDQQPATANSANVPAGLSTNQTGTPIMDAQVASAQNSLDAMMEYGSNERSIY